MSEPSSSKQTFQFDTRFEDRGVFHDIEIGKSSLGFFDEAFLAAFGSDSLGRELESDLARKEADLPGQIQAIRKELEGQIDETVVSEVILEVLQHGDIKRQDYLDVLTRLTDLAQKLIDRGRFEGTLNIFNALYPQTLGGPFQNEASSTLEYFFRSQAFVEDYLKAVKIWGRQNQDAAKKLARALRPRIIGPLIDAALGERDATLRKFYLAMLVEFRSDIVDEVLKRLDRQDAFAIRNLLYLLRKCGSARQADPVKALARHADPKIHTAAVRTLLHFRIGDAIPYVKVYLQGADEGLRDEAIELAGVYRVKETVPDLMEMLEEKDRFGARLDKKKAVVKALGRIGDVSAVHVLLRIVRAKTFLRKGQLDDLKLEVFRNLKNYPLQAIEPILKIGLKTREGGEIHSISTELARALYARRQKGANA